MQELERRKSSEGGSAEGGAYERAKTRTDKNVLEAEKFKATVAQPGNYDLIAPLQSQNTNELGGGEIGEMDVDLNTRGPQMTGQLLIPNIGSGVSDDDFFHLTCHIDPSLIHKIEKGQFVELEKLLPKDKLGQKGDDNRLKWVHRDGGTFLVPVQRDAKI